MGLKDLIDSPYKSPAVRVQFSNGAKPKDILAVEVARSLDSIGTASITSITKSDVSPEDRIKILQGYDNETQIVFTGVVDSIQHNAYDDVYIFSCRDLLKKAMDTFLCQEIKFGVDVDKGLCYYSTYISEDGGTFHTHEYSTISALHAAHPETVNSITEEGVKAEAVVQWLLIMSGLTEGSEIQVDETNFFIGDITPVAFHLTSVYDGIQQICDLIGWYVFCDVGGVVRFKHKPRRASAYVTWKYTEGSNIHSIERISSNTDLRNRIEVHGSSGLKHVALAESPYLGTTIYRGVVIGNEFIDTPGMAEFVANRILSDLNRLKETFSMSCDGNPYLFPGQTIRVSSRAGSGLFFLENTSTTMTADGGYKMNLTGVTFPGDVSDEDTAEIVADFTPMSVTSIGDPKIIVEFDGSISYSTRGPIKWYQWFLPDGTSQIGENPVVWAVFDEAAITNGNTQDITLIVYDSFDYTDTCVSGITLAGLELLEPVKYRHLYAALTTKAAGSYDGGNIWNELELPAISVAASNFQNGGTYTTTGTALFGTSDGKVYKTEDVCVSAKIVLEATGRVTDVFIPELDGAYALAGTSTGEIWRSDDTGITWELVNTLSSPVIQVHFAWDNFNYIFALTDDGVYESWDSGVTFIYVAMPSESKVWWNAAGSATNYYAHASGIWKGITESVPCSGGVSPDIRAMTVMIDRDDGIMAVDNAGQHWVAISGVGGEIHKTQDNVLNITRHMIRDGDIPIICYYATQSGVSKSLDRNETIGELYYPTGGMPASPPDSWPSTGWGEMVAYGPLAPITPPSMGRLVLRGDGIESCVVSGYTTAGLPMYGDERYRSGYFVAYENEFWGYIPDAPPDWQPIVGPGGVMLYGGKYIKYIDMSVISGVHPYAYDVYTIQEVDSVKAGNCSKMKVNNGNVHYVFTLKDNGYPSHDRCVYKITNAFAKNPSYVGDAVFSIETGFKRPGGFIYAYEIQASDTSLADSCVLSCQQGHALQHHWYEVWDLQDIHTDAQQFNDSIYVYPAKFDPPMKVIVQDRSDDMTALHLGPDIFEPTQIPDASVAISVYDSCLVRSECYYATKDEIVRVDAYGQGESTVIFTCPPEYAYELDSGRYGIIQFSVTHDRQQTKDYISVMYAKQNSFWGEGKTEYSTDGGVTWVSGPPVAIDYRGKAVGLWYIDS